jgi:preprotein translocase subunit SecB
MSEQTPPQPAITIAKIYLKDLSLEIPHAPQVFLEREAPQVEVNIHNEHKKLDQENMYETVLTVTLTAKIKDKTVFLVEAAQAGVFELRNVAADDIDPVLGMFCPTQLFPYVREAITGVVARAGFPPVVLDPVNFEPIYRQQQAQREQQAAAAQPTAH